MSNTTYLEALRQRLTAVFMRTGDLQHPDVIRLSQALDALIVQHQTDPSAPHAPRKAPRVASQSGRDTTPPG